jgi:hypothetical protein
MTTNEKQIHEKHDSGRVDALVDKAAGFPGGVYRPMVPKLQVKLISLSYEAAVVCRKEREFSRPPWRGRPVKPTTPEIMDVEWTMPSGEHDPRRAHEWVLYRRMERKWRHGWRDRPTVEELRHHRLNHRDGLRRELRHSYLAYAFIRGVPLSAVEQVNHPHRRGPDWDAVLAMAARFGAQFFLGTQDIEGRFTEWCSARRATK